MIRFGFSGLNHVLCETRESFLFFAHVCFLHCWFSTVGKQSPFFGKLIGHWSTETNMVKFGKRRNLIWLEWFMYWYTYLDSSLTCTKSTYQTGLANVGFRLGYVKSPNFTFQVGWYMGCMLVSKFHSKTWHISDGNYMRPATNLWTKFI